jgi:hypothetical protein
VFDLYPQPEPPFIGLYYFLITAPCMTEGYVSMGIGCLRGANGYLSLESLENGFGKNDLWFNARNLMSNKGGISINGQRNGSCLFV